MSKAARAMGEDGRPLDQKPVMPGDVFLTGSNRQTTPYPKAKGEKAASQWLIDNAHDEAQAQGNKMMARIIKDERPMKDGSLPPASSASMLMMLFTRIT